MGDEFQLWIRYSFCQYSAQSHLRCAVSLTSWGYSDSTYCHIRGRLNSWMCHCQESVLHTGLKDYNKTYPSSVLDCKNTLRFQSDVAGFRLLCLLQINVHSRWMFLHVPSALSLIKPAFYLLWLHYSFWFHNICNRCASFIQVWLFHLSESLLALLETIFVRKLSLGH